MHQTARNEWIEEVAQDCLGGGERRMRRSATSGFRKNPSFDALARSVLYSHPPSKVAPPPETFDLVETRLKQ